MENRDKNGDEVRKIVLPSGRTIEVVYFDGGKSVESVSETKSDNHLHICQSCGSDLVYPTDWREVADLKWEVQLRCPECEWRHTGAYDQKVVDHFDETLDWGTDQLVRNLQEIIKLNMESEIRKFAAALNSNALLPEDF